MLVEVLLQIPVKSSCLVIVVVVRVNTVTSVSSGIMLILRGRPCVRIVSASAVNGRARKTLSTRSQWYQQ